MNWYVELTYADGTKENMYCTSRDEARERRRFYLHYNDPTLGNNPLVSATVRKVS